MRIAEIFADRDPDRAAPLAQSGKRRAQRRDRQPDAHGRIAFVRIPQRGGDRRDREQGVDHDRQAEFDPLAEATRPRAQRIRPQQDSARISEQRPALRGQRRPVAGAVE
jgi:hypothetical protein